MKSIKESLGINPDGTNKINSTYIHEYINLQLLALGLPNLAQVKENEEDEYYQITKSLIENYRERETLHTAALAPADQRIQNFLNTYFEDIEDVEDIKLPTKSFILNHHGIARELSLPKGENNYSSKYISSFRVKQGVLNNPAKDRRTTKGVFHITEGGLPIPADKKSVPKKAAKYIFAKAFSEQGEVMELPYLSNFEQKARTFVSLLLRPLISPEVTGITAEKSMEIRFFTPGSLVSNLDFVESIFGNEGSPYDSHNDAALDFEHWTGHTGCVILAPQLTLLTKKEVGLPHISEATDRQKRDGMCWEKEDELYNEGESFKLTVRTEEGIIVTVIADNYFGYSKKEVKTMMSYAANLYGNVEEEHSGGALVFPAYNQGDYFVAEPEKIISTFKTAVKNNKNRIDLQKEGYGIDKNYKDIFYLPEGTEFNILKQTVSWKIGDKEHSIKLLPHKTYFLPNGNKVRMDKYVGALRYRLVESKGDGTFCHKPCTVSGGGKSEISKSIQDAIITGSFFINDFEKDFIKVEEIINYDYADRFIDPALKSETSREFLSSKRSMGSCIKLLTPSSDYIESYNTWLQSLPQYIKGIAFIIKRFYRKEWGNNWKEHFGVDILNGSDGNELKYKDRKIFARYLRIGYQENGQWRTFKLRQDFVHADKLQMEDDITVSTVVPAWRLTNLGKGSVFPSVKLTANGEYRFFQRPDDAKVRGYDKKAEKDLSTPNTFISNFEPLDQEDAHQMTEDIINFERFTQPMQDLIKGVAENKDAEYFVSSAHPRIVNGKPSANVRYLQTSDNLVNAKQRYIAETGMRLARELKENEPLFIPVTDVLPGRRNNPSAPGIRPLAVYNPVHYQELPELFMDFICSLTGKSPSTTGSGSEGALTKGPFNALCTISDLNNSLLSFILTGYNGYTTPAGHIGKDYKIDHDISVLIPELWSRLSPQEIDPKNMIATKCLEKLDDFEYNGKIVLASRLGYRITEQFIANYFGRVFENPNKVFDEVMLKPELQSIEEFVDGINNIAENQAIVANNYFIDGSVEAAIPPLKALLHIMVYGEYEGMTINSDKFREMFTREAVINSPWYHYRLKSKQNSDIQLWKKHEANTKAYLKKAVNMDPKRKAEAQDNLTKIKEKLSYIQSAKYLENSVGMIGKDSIYK